MNREFAEKWATALESGEYEQTKGVLFDGKGYCCLGVACALLGEIFVKNSFSSSSYYIDDECDVLPNRIRDKIEMKNTNGYINELNTSLVSLNDRGKSFKEIAQVIRDNVEFL